MTDENYRVAGCTYAQSSMCHHFVTRRMTKDGKDEKMENLKTNINRTTFA